MGVAISSKFSSGKIKVMLFFDHPFRVGSEPPAFPPRISNAKCSVQSRICARKAKKYLIECCWVVESGRLRVTGQKCLVNKSGVSEQE